MIFKVIAITAAAMIPCLARAQGTTQTQDTTAMGHTQSHMDSTHMSSRKMNKPKVKVNDSTSMHASRHSRRHMTDSSSMNVSPVDSARMGVPSTKQTSTPPR
ncbi:MAG: hypothetical protein H0U66_18365 [Gemmatimonadaceae bacterium]|nr:hypothetical protein [Gemmatimonadaceae bacterium]